MASATRNDSTPKRKLLWSEAAGKLLALISVAAAAILLIVYGWLALRWQQQPFVGAFFSYMLRVENIPSISGEALPAFAVGVRPGDRLIAINDVRLSQNPHVAQAQFQQELSRLEPGQLVTMRLARAAGGPTVQTRTQCAPDSASGAGDRLLCSTMYRLAPMQTIDFVSLFVVSFGVGVLGVIFAGVLLWKRWNQPVARQIAVLSALLSVVASGLYDTYTGHQITPLVQLSGMVLVGGMLLILALTFPSAQAALRRRPALRFAPLAPVAIVLGLMALMLYSPSPDRVWFPGPLAYSFVLICAAIYVVALARRLNQSVSPTARDQTTIGLVSLLLAIAPSVVWVITIGLQSLLPAENLTFHFSLATPFFLLLPLGLVYALAQDRLPDSDRVITRGIVYGLMAGGVGVGYGLVVAGATLFAGSAVQMNNPVVIAVLVFLMALLFVPVRNLLERRVDSAYFRTHRLYQQRVESLAQDLTRVNTLGGIVDAIRRHLTETLAPTHAFLFFPDPESEQYIAHGVPVPETDVRFSARSPLVQLLGRQQRVLYLEAGQPLPADLAPERARLAVLGAPVLVPLRGQERLSGILFVGPRQSFERYHYDDLRFIQSLADQAALAVERAQVIANLEQRVREMNVLGQVAQAVNFTIEFDDLLELIYAQTNRVIVAPNFYIALRDPNTDEMYFAFYSESDERIQENEGDRWRMGRDLLSEIVRGGQPMRVENYAAEAARRGGFQPLKNPNLKAWIGVPLSAPGTAIGVMCVGSTQANVTYGDDQLKILWQIADQAATAIDKARLFRETQIRARQLSALNQISTQLANVFKEPERLLELITESAVTILEAEAGSLLMIDSETNELEFKVAIGSEADHLVGTRLAPGTGLVGTVADRGEPVIVNDTTRDPRWFSGVDDDIQFRTDTLMAAPLIGSAGVIGVLEVINKHDGGVFVEDDKRLLMTFAGQAAIAIENARLFQMTDQQLAARVEELDTMQRIDRELNETLELRRVLDLTLGWAMRESDAVAGAVAMLVGEGDALEVVAHQGYPDGVETGMFGMPLPVDHGVAGRVVRSGRPELVSDVRFDDDYMEVLPGGRSQLTVPLVTGGKASGVILLESDRENAFSLLDLDFVTRLAEHASPAMANASLFDQLQRANAARSEFVGVVAHELKTPMTSIRGFADLLLGGVVGPMNEQQRNFLGTIRSNADRLTSLINDLNDVTKLQTDRMAMEMAPINFGDVVQETLRPLQRLIEDKGQRIDLQVSDKLPAIYADQNRLIQVMTNLITNAHKYTPDEGTIVITARPGRNVWDSKGAPEVLHVTVKDDGIGISEEDQAQLFKPYFRTTNPEALDQPGTGLGLVIVRGIIQQHGGQIWLESKLGQGSTFHVTIPLASAVPEARQKATAAD